ncbi:tRNA pseudouridine synthase B [Lactococcus hodotermopsidis]|uniref:tRNA pseudouridine synthase B n=1 Tax=Pseudolactococcus hodotermopsidis TaxID=2709157 RepID=A0A6A0BB45_9LACT|nr:tRNA pseudouridine(55) synthase TruB [Lactococcus hodotermopsidis]GFH42572.1 tRNA pseudouridine synthase B [Lactococcus hodotermopsidis]
MNNDGILNVYKETGMTSHDVVFKLRKILQTKKIGHGGTLDPDVTGVLPIAVGKATRVVEFMTEAGKVYEGQVTLGFSTETEDASGAIVARTPVTSAISAETIDSAMRGFVGTITQIPPMYSAVKVNGRKLYEYARAGETVARPERSVTISEFVRTSEPIFDADNQLIRFDFRVACSKGTYVRTLAVDLGAKLGFASHMSYLQRTASAGLTIDKALKLSEIEQLKAENRLETVFLPIEYGVSDLEKIELSDEQVSEIKFGRFINISAENAVVAGFQNGQLIAILQQRDGKLYKPKKVMI